MNQIMRDYYSIFEQYQALRTKLMALLSDEDLCFSPGGNNLSLGALCREIGEIQASYLESFRTFKHDLGYRVENAVELESSVTKLEEWFVTLDTELKQVVSSLTDEDIVNKPIERGTSFKLPANIQLTIYSEALLIFYGKASVYLKTMEKELPKQWQEWIA